MTSEAGAIVDGVGKRQGPAENIDSTIIDGVSRLTNNPTGLLSALGDLQHAANVGEITKGQFSGFPVIQNVLDLIRI